MPCDTPTSHPPLIISHNTLWFVHRDAARCGAVRLQTPRPLYLATSVMDMRCSTREVSGVLQGQDGRMCEFVSVRMRTREEELSQRESERVSV